jgi:putative Mg2+ transporter-C (MgtC) family protein
MITEADILLRLGAAALLGSIVGFERERLMWAAGIRTHMLVAVGACLFMIVSAYGFQHAIQNPHVILDPSRIAAQVVSGIGFLGAGSILLRGQIIRGLTTAASIWSVAALGLACGGGLYFAATAATVIILVILVGIKPLEELYRVRARSGTLLIVARHGEITAPGLAKRIGVSGRQVRRIVIEQGDETDRITIQLVRITRRQIDDALSTLRADPAIREAALEG